MTTRTALLRSPERWLRAPGPMVWRRAFPGSKDQVPRARKFIEGLFTDTGQASDAGIIITELVNNAVIYTNSGKPGGWFGIEVTLEDLSRISVTDQGGAGRPTINNPLLDDPDTLSLSGRGLFIVAELATTIGIHGSPAQGHTVWAELDLTTKTREELAAQTH